jgi:putative acetyltransferase
MISIRPYRTSDRAACRQVFQRAVREGAAGFYDAAQREAWAPEVPPDPDHRLDKLHHQLTWVAEVDGAITGFMSMTRSGHLDMAFVLPEVMGKGHAAALHDRMLSEARGLGLARLTVHASEYSRRFLGRRGWDLDGVEVIRADNGAQWDRNLMSLDLSQAGSGEVTVG